MAAVPHARPQRFPRDVFCDPKQPGRKLGFLTQHVQAAEGPDEGLLGQLFRQSPIGNEVIDKTDHGSRIPFKDQAEGLLVALGCTRN